MRKQSIFGSQSEKGTVEALCIPEVQATFASPGMTGTGAPVIEHLRHPAFAG